ncbi:MAG: DNA cytosine methyltransferase [Firmicutes bacterium]|nr:DNA cytosine methyltransferase [Bacillota bacterium]
MKLASLFAGIGGIDLGFEQAEFTPIWANEIDINAAKTFNLNHKKTRLIVDDICKIKGADIPAVEVLTGGFPCQAFSVAGYRKGFEDDRGNLFFQIIRLLTEMEELDKLPKILLLENVKNLYSHDNGNTFKVIKSELKKLGYHLTAEVLNSMDFGNVPQNRERIYIVAFLDKETLQRFVWPQKIPLTNTIDKLISRNLKVYHKYYYHEDKKSYEMLKENITSKKSIYQFRRVYVRENKSGVCPTLTANMGTGGHNVPLILDNDNNIRKLTPRECLNLQGFPQNFEIPKNIADSHIYKQVGNSVTVPVIKRIAESIKKAVKNQ